MDKSTVLLILALSAFVGGVIWYNNRKPETSK